MRFELPPLPFDHHALEPHMRAETLRYHHGKHHAGYVETLNELLDARGEDPESLEVLVRQAEGAVFQNAAQASNHEFFWSCLSPDGGGEPSDQLASALTDSFGGVDAFRSAFTEVATNHFGSGWAWLVQTKEGRLDVLASHDADTPLRMLRMPLLTCDLWEHAYYLDHRNDRAAYLEAFWNLVNWETAEQRLVWTPLHASRASSS